MKLAGAFLAVALAAYSSVQGQELDMPRPAVAMGAVPAGTSVRVALSESLSSKTSKRGDRFGITLAEPIISDGNLLIPAGAPGIGEVVSASPRGFWGTGGELVLAARYIDFNDQIIPLRSLRLTAVGGNVIYSHEACKVAKEYCHYGIFNVEIPSGTEAIAKLSKDITIPILGNFDPAHPPSDSEPPTEKIAEDQ